MIILGHKRLANLFIVVETDGSVTLIENGVITTNASERVTLIKNLRTATDPERAAVAIVMNAAPEV